MSWERRGDDGQYLIRVNKDSAGGHPPSCVLSLGGLCVWLDKTGPSSENLGQVSFPASVFCVKIRQRFFKLYAFGRENNINLGDSPR